MPDNPLPASQMPRKVICEIVAYRYADEVNGIMLLGEAEVWLEYEGLGPVAPDQASANLHSVRVDILSAFDPDDKDAYDDIMADGALRQAVEGVALEHFLRPPSVPVGLPRQIIEW